VLDSIPDSPTAESLNATGADFYLKGDVTAARFHYLAALKLDPNNVNALANLGQLCGESGNFHTAITYYRRALELDPKNAKHWNNLGNTFMRLNDFDNAREALTNALDYSIDNIDIYYNFALVAYRQGKFQESKDYLDRTIFLGNWSRGIQSDFAHINLALGENLTEALAKYEARWYTLPHLPAWDFHIPEWQGESLRDKRILLHGEQGFGDDIMCSRFVKNLTARGAEVHVACHKALVPLFVAQNWSTYNMMTLDRGIMGQFHFQTPMFSALRHLEYDWHDIKGEPYLRAPKKFKPNLNTSLFKIGICWASGKRGDWNDWRRRYVPLKDWLTLACLPRVQLVSLQFGSEADEIDEIGADGLVLNLMNQVENWADTADLIMNLDLVISVDTAVAHLAGALGKPVWMLSQFSRCWRWKNIETESGAPWYDSMKVFKQRSPGDWAEQLDYCRSKLEIELDSLKLAAE
jgi:tetratricopeptide (TPR) repeat protein